MIRPRLLHLGSTDLIDPPQDPTCCMVAVTARIGTSDGDAGDDFHFTVATPDGLAEHGYAGWGQAMLILPAFSWPAVERAVERLLAPCAGASWEAVAATLAAHLRWEYEGYRLPDG